MPSLVAKPQQPIQGLTERMYKTIDKKTGCCIIHPKVRLCVYDEEKQRWVIKRKTCFQCGSRSGVGGKHHRHGCSVRDPTRHRISQDSYSSDRSGKSGTNSCSSVIPMYVD